MNVDTAKDVAVTDALVQLNKALLNLDAGIGSGEAVRLALAAALDETVTDWRERTEVIERIKVVGPREAARGLLRKYLTR